MGSHLIPTPVVNKNGVLTTVHKRPVKEQQLPDLSLPRLHELKIQQSAAEQVMGKLTLVFGNWHIPVPKYVSRESVETYLFSLPKKTQKLLLECLEKHEKDNALFMGNSVISLLEKKRSPEVISDVLYVYNNTNDMMLTTINSDWNKNDGFDGDLNVIITLEWLGRHYGALTGYEYDDNSKELRDYDEKTRQQVVALFDMTNYLAESGDFPLAMTLVTTPQGELFLRDSRLAQLVVDHADRYSDMMDIIEERKTLDPEIIGFMLTNGSSAVRSGVL